MAEVVHEQTIGIASGIMLFFFLTLELLVLGLQVEGCVAYCVYLPEFEFLCRRLFFSRVFA